MSEAKEQKRMDWLFQDNNGREVFAGDICIHIPSGRQVRLGSMISWPLFWAYHDDGTSVMAHGYELAAIVRSNGEMG